MHIMPLPLAYALFGLLGLLFGSFGNVLVLRLAEGTGIGGRSKCPKCKHVLKWYDLFPLASYVLLQARCRYCRDTISPQYFAVELLSACLFLLAFSFTPHDLLLSATTAMVLFGLLLICVFDIKYQQIPDVFTLLVLLGAVGSMIIKGMYITSIQGGLLVFCWFAFQWLVSRGKFVGSGDILLGAALGVWLGLGDSIVMLFVSYILGAVVAIVLLVSGAVKLKGTQLPFGPFLAAGAIIASIGF